MIFYAQILSCIVNDYIHLYVKHQIRPCFCLENRQMRTVLIAGFEDERVISDGIG